MATHHLTPPVRGGERPRLPSTQKDQFSRRRESVQKVDTLGLGGPVTQAIRAMRAAQPKAKSEIISHLPADISELRRRIADRIEADLALLDALDGDCDLEDDDPAGGDINDEPHDPEEDGCAVEDAGHFLLRFDGTNYAPFNCRRRA